VQAGVGEEAGKMPAPKKVMAAPVFSNPTEFTVDVR
jgi:hypothetical protein